jgi:hypothetical protein
MTNMQKHPPPPLKDITYAQAQFKTTGRITTEILTHGTPIFNPCYTRKGDSKDPKNERPICLKETTTKIISTIIAKHLLDHLNTI